VTVYQNFISYLYEAQHVSDDTPPIIRTLKLHSQPLVLHTWRVVGRVVAGRSFHTLSHLVGFFNVNYTMMRGSMNIKSLQNMFNFVYDCKVNCPIFQMMNYIKNSLMSV
jgi:hypothetical protein